MPLSKAKDRERKRIRLESGSDQVGKPPGKTQYERDQETYRYHISEWERCNPELAARLKPGERYANRS